MKEYPLYKKRDGQYWKEIGYILADNYKEAKKEFARRMTDDYWEQSNNIVWLDKSDGVDVEGWYDFNGGSPLFYEETNTYDKEEAKDFLLLSKKDIDRGFSVWTEDVYWWTIDKNQM